MPETESLLYLNVATTAAVGAVLFQELVGPSATYLETAVYVALLVMCAVGAYGSIQASENDE